MRQLIIGALAIVLSTAGSASTRQASDSDIWISIAAQNVAGGMASVRALNSEIYIEGPAAGIGVERASDDLMFTIKAWKEGDRARVVVSARLKDTRAPGGFTETPISTFRIAARESVEVAESQRWGGPRLLLRAFVR